MFSTSEAHVVGDMCLPCSIPYLRTSQPTGSAHIRTRLFRCYFSSHNVLLQKQLYFISATWGGKSRCYCPCFTDDKVKTQKAIKTFVAANEGILYKVKFWCSYEFNIWLFGNVLSASSYCTPRVYNTYRCLLGAHEGHQMNEQSLESGLPGFSLLTPTLSDYYKI